MDKPKKWGAALGRLLFYALMCVGLWLMLAASASYLELGEAHPFLLEKLPQAQPKLWLSALYLHVPSALLSLPACLLLLVGRVRSRWPRFHRWLGRLTGAIVLFALVPSGMYLALFAQGGLLSTLGFWLTGSITFVAMLKSIQSARAKNMRAHRRFATHVAAQLAVAVVSRFLLVGAEAAGLYGAWAYIAALWLPVLGCALVAELLTVPGKFSNWCRTARYLRPPHKDFAMKSSLPFLISMLCASVAAAELGAPPSTTPTQVATAALVEKQLLTPLKQTASKRSRFSRAAPVATAFRVRVLDTAPRTDTRGKPFVRFAIDQRRSRNEQAAWDSDGVLGCAYLDEGTLFVRIGEAYFSAKVMLGKDEKERPDVCLAAPANV